MLFNEDGFEESESLITEAYERGELPEVRFRRHSSFEPPEPDLELIFAGITVWGELLTQWATPKDADLAFERVLNSGGASFLRSTTRSPIRNLVVCGDHRVDIKETSRASSDVQMLSDGRVIQVAGRARWTPDGGEKNAGLYSPEGDLLKEACVGDGIAKMYTDAEDRLWIGYFDEGVLGNYGWGSLWDEKTEQYYPTEAPIGEPGLNRYTADLSLDWSYPGDTKGAPWICDIYALNVGLKGVWNCSYTDFAVTRIVGDEVEVICKEGPAASYLVADDERFAALYPYDLDVFNYGVRVPEGIEHRGIGALRSPEGKPLKHCYLDAHDDVLYAICGNEVWKLDLQEIARLDRGALDRWYG